MLFKTKFLIFAGLLLLAGFAFSPKQALADTQNQDELGGGCGNSDTDYLVVCNTLTWGYWQSDQYQLKSAVIGNPYISYTRYGNNFGAGYVSVVGCFSNEFGNAIISNPGNKCSILINNQMPDNAGIFYFQSSIDQPEEDDYYDYNYFNIQLSNSSVSFDVSSGYTTWRRVSINSFTSTPSDSVQVGEPITINWATQNQSNEPNEILEFSGPVSQQSLHSFLATGPGNAWFHLKNVQGPGGAGLHEIASQDPGWPQDINITVSSTPQATVNVTTNLPPGATACWNLSGPSNPGEKCGASFNYPGLTPGSYNLTANSQASNGYVLDDPPISPVPPQSVAGGGVLNFNIFYRAPGTGTTPTPPESRSLTMGINGSGSVTDGQDTCTGPTTCAPKNYPINTTVYLTATPASSAWEFGHWSGCDTASVDGCTVLMSNNRNVSATFYPVVNPSQYSLTVNKTGSGAVTSSPSGINCPSTCSASFDPGTSVTLTAAPASGYSLSNWSGCDSTSGATCNVIMSNARSVTVTFTSNPGPGTACSTIQVNSTTADPYTITGPDQTWGANGTQTFAGHVEGFYSISAPGGTAVPTSGTVTGCSTLTFDLTFGTSPGYTLTVTKNGSGTVTSSPAGINCGATCTSPFPTYTSVTLYASPASGWTFSSWSGGNCGNPCVINGNKTITANFTSNVQPGTGTVCVTASTGDAYFVSGPGAGNSWGWAQAGQSCFADHPTGYYSVAAPGACVSPNGQILANNGGTIYFTVTFGCTPPPPPGPPAPPPGPTPPPPPASGSFQITYTPLPINAPSMSSIDNSTCGRIVTTWSFSGTGLENGFKLYRSTDNSSWALIASPTLGTSSYNDTPPGTLTYYYMIRSYSNAPSYRESDNSNSLSAVNLGCLANLSNSNKTLTKVNGAAYTSSTKIQNGDTLTFQIVVSNYGPANATINYICDTPSSNLSGLTNLQTTGGSNGGITENSPSCTSGIRLNISGAKAVGNPNWVVTFDATLDATSPEQLDFVSNSAAINYTDNQTRNQNVSTGGILFQTGNAKAPNFREVAP